MLGVYEISIRKISFETGIDKTTIEKALKDFESVNKVKFVNGYIFLNNFIKHQSYNPNMKKSAVNVYNELPSELKESNLQTVDSQNINKGFEMLCKGFGIVRKIEDEVEDEIEVEDELETKVEIPFLTEWDILFNDWFDYKKDRKETYKNAKSIEAFKTKLKNMSKNNIKTAKEIIADSMANNYAGIFEPREIQQKLKPIQHDTDY